MNPRAWGVEPGYYDVWGKWNSSPPEAIAAVLDAMSADGDSPPEPDALIVDEGSSIPLTPPAEVITEDGRTVVMQSAGRPSEIGLGYHTVTDATGGERALIVVPRRCHLPDDLWTWGWALQLYALRSASSWGMGDLGDLQEFVEWAGENGAGAVLLNPLHATLPHVDRASPYFPSSRYFRNPIYIRVADVTSADGSEYDEAARAGTALNRAPQIDRARVYKLKLSVLERLWMRVAGNIELSTFIRENDLVERFATFVVIAEQHGARWRDWPPELRHPDNHAAAHFARAHSDRVRFHVWLQLLLDRQLRRAAEAVLLLTDLAVGVDPDGADAWMLQDYFAPGVTVGAPPDDFNLEGQGWGLLAFDPWRLRAGAYEPFAKMIRASLRHAGGLRYDHVMGLFRLFWIPDGTAPSGGAYVRYPHRDLLGILALESVRAKGIIVGEDLGTVSPGVREELAARAILSYRLMWFEADPPARWPAAALAAVTNHDLPTVAGLWSGRDLEDQQRNGVVSGHAFASDLRARLARLADIDPAAGPQAAVEAAYRLLGDAPCRLVIATVEDALGVALRPNLPGTTEDRRPNWSVPLPATLEQIKRHPGPRVVAKLIEQRRLGSKS
jgi:4-alpha-glucanotransferase